MIDQESSQPGMHKRRKGIVTAMQAVRQEGIPPCFVRVGCDLWAVVRHFWVEEGLNRTLNLDMMLADHQPNPFPSEYLSNVQILTFFSITGASILTTLVCLHPLLVFAGVREDLLGLLTWPVELKMA